MTNTRPVALDILPLRTSANRALMPGALKAALAAAVLLALVLAPNVASAQCEPGTYRCGEQWCVPNGRVCCASVGRPDGHCPGGTRCTEDGLCQGGAEQCEPGFYQCGERWCIADGNVCCASVGRPDRSCPNGTQCTPDGQCAGGGGGGGGNDGGNGGGGAGRCPPGSFQCGEGWCVPDGTACCAHVGFPGRYCEAGLTCTADGFCAAGGGQGGGGVGDGGVGGGAPGLCTDTCRFAFDGVCDDGRPGAAFSVCQRGSDCSDCSGGGADDEPLGCSSAPGRSGGALMLAALLVGALLRRRAGSE